MRVLRTQKAKCPDRHPALPRHPTRSPSAPPHRRATAIRQPAGKLGAQGGREAGSEARQARALGKAGSGPPAAPRGEPLPASPLPTAAGAGPSAGPLPPPRARRGGEEKGPRVSLLTCRRAALPQGRGVAQRSSLPSARAAAASLTLWAASPLSQARSDPSASRLRAGLSEDPPQEKCPSQVGSAHRPAPAQQPGAEGRVQTTHRDYFLSAERKHTLHLGNARAQTRGAVLKGWARGTPAVVVSSRRSRPPCAGSSGRQRVLAPPVAAPRLLPAPQPMGGLDGMRAGFSPPSSGVCARARAGAGPGRGRRRPELVVARGRGGGSPVPSRESVPLRGPAVAAGAGPD